MNRQCANLSVTVAFMVWLSASLAAEQSNQPPRVEITYPYPAGGSYYYGGTVKIMATASDPDGRVVRVEFFASGVPIGIVTNAPYTVRWPTGLTNSLINVDLVARAYDDQGLYSDSQPVRIFIVQDPFGPAVFLVAPTNGLVVSSAQRVRGCVRLYNTDDDHTEVEILWGTNVVARSTEPPFEFLLGPFPPGDQVIQARGKFTFRMEWNLSSPAVVRALDLKLSPPVLRDGAVQFQIEGLPAGQSWGVEASENLSQWSLFATGTAMEPVRITDSITNGPGSRFYRAIAPAPR